MDQPQQLPFIPASRGLVFAGSPACCRGRSPRRSCLVDVVDSIVRIRDEGVYLKGAFALPLTVKGVDSCLSFGFVDVPRANGNVFGLSCEIKSRGHESQGWVPSLA